MHVCTAGISIVSLLLHAVLGCCWHHTHADGCHTHESAAAACLHESPTDEHADSHDHAGHRHVEHHDAETAAHDADGEPSQAPQPCGTDCEDDRCSFVRADSQPETDPLGDGAPVVLLAELGARSIGLPALRAASGSPADSPHPAPSLRAHLLYGVLLI